MRFGQYQRLVILALVFLIFLGALVFPTPSDLSQEAQRAIAIFIACVLLWVTQVIPLMITSLLAIILFPLLGVLPASRTYALFGNQAIFFILGALILASALIRSGLSTRIALVVLKFGGRTPKMLLLSVLSLAAALAYGISAHAVAAMLFPIISELILALKLREDSLYAKSLFLAMAWGCIIGSTGTLLGGARAPLALGILAEISHQAIGFAHWMLAALPTMLAMLVVAYFVLRRFFPMEIKEVSTGVALLTERVERLGPLKGREYATGALMLGTCTVWVFWGDQLGLANIAIAAVVVAFIFNLMRWHEVEEDVNWGIILMYGGAICLGSAMAESGASAWLAAHSLARLGDYPWLWIPVLSLISLGSTEAISNSAVVALLMPIAIGYAQNMQFDPRTVTLAITIPSGFAFILPMGTPATAIAFSSGFVGQRDTLVSGLVLNLSAWFLFNLFARLYWPWLGFGL